MKDVVLLEKTTKSGALAFERVTMLVYYILKA
jgi:hypothetical protein